MLYFVHSEDKEGGLPIRQENRSAHIEYIKDYTLLAAGPTLSEDGETMTGSVLIIDVPNRAVLDEFLANDPYAKADLFSKVTVKPWKKVILQDNE